MFFILSHYCILFILYNNENFTLILLIIQILNFGTYPILVSRIIYIIILCYFGKKTCVCTILYMCIALLNKFNFCEKWKLQIIPKFCSFIFFRYSYNIIIYMPLLFTSIFFHNRMPRSCMMIPHLQLSFFYPPLSHIYQYYVYPPKNAVKFAVFFTILYI